MKKSTIITIIAFVVGVVVLATGFILLTDNNISKSIRDKKTTTTTTPTTTPTTTAPAVVHNPMNLFAEDVTKYITLGDYKGMTIEVDQLEATEEDIDFYLQQLLAIDGEYSKKREGIIAEKVVFNFDYTGYLLKDDGTKDKAFDGGAGTNQLAYIADDVLYTLSSSGVGTFIDGFAQGILGQTVGETFDIDVTFPENYQSSDLAGKKVIFEIKLNHIAEGTVTDGWVKEYTDGEYETCADYREYMRSSINDNLKSNNMAILWDTIIENAVIIEIPEQEYEYWYYYYRDQVEYYVTMYQMYGYSYTYEEMLVMFGFENDDALKEHAKEMVIEELIIFAVIQAENIQATDDEYRILLDSLIEQMGKSEEEVLQTYSEEKIRQQIILNKVDGVVEDLNTFVLKVEE